MLQWETNENVEKVQEKIEKLENMKINIDSVKNQVTTNTGCIEEVNQWEMVNIREELKAIKNRPIHIPNIQLWDNRETINFWDYKRNPMEF